jgi:hypothetical protein
MPEQTTITVEISPLAYQLLEQFAADEKRPATAIVEDSLRMYAERVEAFRRMEEAMKRSHELARENGTSEMTMDEINLEIATYRAEKRLREKMAPCES